MIVFVYIIEDEDLEKIVGNNRLICNYGRWCCIVGGWGFKIFEIL